MDALRTDLRIRFTTIFEWVVAALFLCATIAVCSLILHALFAPAAPATILLAPVEPIRPPSVPSEAASVPELPLADGQVVHIGATLSSTAVLLGRSAETGRQEVEPGRFGERLTRFYEHDGSRFVLVFEPFERDGESRLAAIYLIR